MHKSGIMSFPTDPDDWNRRMNVFASHWELAVMGDRMRHIGKGALSRVLGSIPGVYGVGIEHNGAGHIVVDLSLVPWGAEKGDLPNGVWLLEHLVLLEYAGHVLKESRPVGVTWEIKQETEMKEELPGFAALAERIPELKSGVVKLMEHLDMWTLRSMRVVVDEDGRFKRMAETNKERGARGTGESEAKWTVLLCEFLVPSEQADQYTTLVRSAQKMSRLGEEGSLTHSLEATVKSVQEENENLTWEAGQALGFAEECLALAQELMAAPTIGEEHLVPEPLVDRYMEAKKALEHAKGMTGGGHFLQRYRKMEAAVHERRPEVAAELLRGLDEE